MTTNICRLILLAVLVQFAASACQNNAYAVSPSGVCQCISGYYMPPDVVAYCAICHSSCKTCSGPLSTNCISCVTGFTLSGSTCIEPNSITDATQVKAYYF